MRFQLTSTVVLVMILATLPVRAVDWKLKLAEEANGKKLTHLSIKKPFWVILTNCTDHDLALLRYHNICQYLDLDFLFTNRKAEEVPVAIGSYSETWNLCGPEVVAPGKSFLIKVDFRSGNWLHTNELEGRVTVKVIYYHPDWKPSESKPPAARYEPRPPVWTGKVESEPIQVTIVR